MSNDDSQEKKPLKLRLSRDVENEAPSEKVEDAPLPDAQPTVDPIVEQPASKPPKTTRSPIVQHRHREPEAIAPEQAAAPKADVDPTPTPPPASDLEDTINSLDSKQEVAPVESSLLPSIIVLFILFLILAGAGYGLWAVLQAPESTQQQVAPSTSTPASAKSNSPVERAKETIAKVPVADVDAIADLEPTNSEALPTTEEPSTSASAPAPEEGISNKAAAALEANKQSISQFLTQVHIDGVRKGERPMVIIKGRSYLVGDTVQTETGLKFAGIRKGRLAFQDENGIVYLKSF